ncbi:MAG TPA: uroporphyrinogen-III synthase [Alphaproteobacteria bacterium]
MKLLVTRPREDGLATAAALHKIRVKAILEPLYRLEQENEIPPLGGPYQALLFTSRNGAKAFSRLFGIPDLPCFCVGDRTAETARELGFHPVYSANGNAEDLAVLVQQHCPPTEGPLFRAAGDHDDDPLSDALTALHYTIDTRTLYRAVPVPRLQRGTVTGLLRHFIDGAVFFSPAAAHHFKNLLIQDNLTETCAQLEAFCISQAAARQLDGLNWRAVHIAAHPSQEAMLQLIEQHRHHAHDVTETSP